VFTRSVKKAIGGFVALMGGLDALIFSGGIGEHDAQSRAEIAGGLAGIGISIDSALNVASESGLRRISASESGTVIFVVPSQEDLMIASHVDRMSRVGL
jgi:acetate kinase